MNHLTACVVCVLGCLACQAVSARAATPPHPAHLVSEEGAVQQRETGRARPRSDTCRPPDKPPAMCAKLPMQPDGITRLSTIEVYPEYREEYLKYATEVGERSLRQEPGVLVMYAMAEKDDPNRITILEIYASQEAYKAHIASPHFRKYKQGTLKMVKSLRLADQSPLNPASRLDNFMVD